MSEEVRHQLHLAWISTKGWALIVLMWFGATLFAGIVGLFFARLVTPESWWTP